MNFVDSYKYNIATYSLAELIGLDDMVPVYVERKWKGDSGSLLGPNGLTERLTLGASGTPSIKGNA